MLFEVGKTDLPRIQKQLDSIQEGAWTPGQWYEECLRARVFAIGSCQTRPKALACVRTQEDIWELTQLYCWPEFRKQGLARQLMQWTQKLAHLQPADIWLEVDENNTKALELYQSLGFTQNGRRLNYYGHGRNAINLVSSGRR